MSLFRLHGPDRRISPYCNTRVPISWNPCVFVISECATCDRRERVCVLFLATPNCTVICFILPGSMNVGHFSASRYRTVGLVLTMSVSYTHLTLPTICSV